MRGIDIPIGQAVSRLPEHLAKPVDETGEESQAAAEPPLNIAIVGRPNVGKSSIINALTRSERVIVSEISGTTRDAIDVPFEVETDGVRQRYNLIDTAGIRKRRRIKDPVEFFSVNRADKAIERCDLAVLVIDAAEGVTEQDKKICDRITDAGCACVIVVNKWDLFQAGLEKARKREAKKTAAQGGHKLSRKKREELMYEEFGKWVKSNLFFIDYAPVIFTSATEGFQLDRLLEAIRYVSSQLQKTTPTSLLNRSLQAALERSPAPSSKGHRFKLFLRHAGQLKTADVPALRQPQGVAERQLHALPHRRVAQVVRLRGMPHPARGQAAPQKHRADPPQDDGKKQDE